MCGETIEVYVEAGFTHKAIMVACGDTSPDGTPWLCSKCAKKHQNRDWRREAEEAGEQWDSDY